MPRRSVEALAAAVYRAGGSPPEPPKDLGASARALWCQIAASKSPDWFDPANLRLLRRYCRTAITAEIWHDRLDQAEVGSPASVALCKLVIALNASIGVMAAKLRLTVQNQIDRRSGKLNERGLGDIDPDGLLGGRGLRQ